MTAFKGVRSCGRANEDAKGFCCVFFQSWGASTHLLPRTHAAIASLAPLGGSVSARLVRHESLRRVSKFRQKQGHKRYVMHMRE